MSHNPDSWPEGDLADLIDDQAKEKAAPIKPVFGRPIVCTPGIQSGRPCFEGSRFPVRSLWPWILHGYSNHAILEAYPTLTEQDVAMARMIYESAG